MPVLALRNPDFSVSNGAQRFRNQVADPEESIAPAAIDRQPRSSLQRHREYDPGLHLGYRKLKGSPGRWVVRHYVGEQAYSVETIATADDLSTANGVDVLDFRQAQEAARERRDRQGPRCRRQGGLRRRRCDSALHQISRSQGAEDH